MWYNFFQGTSVSITFYIFEHYQLWMMDRKAQRVFFPKTPKLCVWHTEVRNCYHFKLVSHFQLWFTIWGVLVNRLKKWILLKVTCGGRAGAFPEHQPLSEQQYESGFTRLRMSIYNRERIKFSTFISSMRSFMTAYSGKVTSLLGQTDGLSYATPWVRLYFLEPSCINCISGIYVIHLICALMAVMLNKVY